MSEAKHTPGPWEASEPHPITHVAAIRAVGEIPAEVAAVISADVFPANARLIAAAPELLAACKAAEAWMSEELKVAGRDFKNPALDQVRIAIAKAEAQ